MSKNIVNLQAFVSPRGLTAGSTVLPVPWIPRSSRGTTRKVLEAYEGWLIKLLRALPDLLTELVRPDVAISLERLQLVSVSIGWKRDSHGIASGSWANKQVRHEENNFLTLLGELVYEQRETLLMDIKYFLCGQRQFFKPPIDLPQLEKIVALPAIEPHDVGAFFQALEQNNNYLWDRGLAMLNGRPMPPVPTQMIMALALSYATKIPRERIECDRRYEFIFHHAVQPARKLDFAYSLSSDALRAAIFCDGHCAVIFEERAAKALSAEPALNHPI
ncbi:MAG TPA: hypothetical protein VEL47_05915 [Myxococcota bacterium]|nr:hypothetical protein [Myxococcota bacterium]